MTASSRQSYAPSFRPKEDNVSEKKIKAEKKKGVEKEKLTKQKGKEKAQKAEPHIPEMFVMKNMKKSAAAEDPSPSESVKVPKKQRSQAGLLADEFSDDGSNDSDEQSVGGGDEEIKTVVNLASLIDIKKPQPKLGKLRSGRPVNSLIDNLSQRCYHIDKPEKHIFRCLGSCGMTYASRNCQRIVRHAAGCSHLPADIRKQAKAYLAKQAPSRKLPIGDPESSKVSVEKLDEETLSRSKESGHVVAVKKRKLDETAWFEEAKKLGRKERHQKLDLTVVKLFCCSGIPTHIAESPVWKALLAYADPSYTPASRATLEEVHIPAEAENIHEIQLAYLRTQENITISCDGGTTRGKEAFWTIHMSTLDRKVYLMDVREATAVSHTAVWIKKIVLEVRQSVRNT